MILTTETTIDKKVNPETTLILEINQQNTSIGEQEQNLKMNDPEILSEAITVDEFLVRAGGLGIYQWRLLFLLGCGCYAGSIVQTIQLVFLEHRIEEEFGEISDVAHSALFVGWGLITPLLLSFSDKIGRRSVLLFSLAIISIVSLLHLVVNSAISFILCRAAMGAALGVQESVGYVLLIEFMPPLKREYATIIISLMTSLVAMLFCGVSYMLSSFSWRTVIVLEAIPTFLILCICHLIPSICHESPRYLLEKKEYKNALRVLKRVCETNAPNQWNRLRGVTLIDQGSREMATPLVSETVFTRIGVLFSPSLRWVSLGAFWCWFTGTLCYYGLSFEADHLSGSVYQNMFWLYFVEIPALPLCNYLIANPQWGRKGTLESFGLLISGAMFLQVITNNETASLLCAMVGKFGASAVYAVIYLYSSEIFPTTVRGTGIGLCHFFAKTGGVIAPFITEFSISVAFFFFGSFCLLMALITRFILPETLGKPL